MEKTLELEKWSEERGDSPGDVVGNRVSTLGPTTEID